MDITGLDKAEILAALYNGSSQQGLGVFCVGGRENMTVAQARALLDKTHKFDYVNGRVMKIEFETGEFENDLYTALYNRDNGPGAAEKIIAQLREMQQMKAKREEPSS